MIQLLYLRKVHKKGASPANFTASEISLYLSGNRRLRNSKNPEIEQIEQLKKEKYQK